MELPKKTLEEYITSFLEISSQAYSSTEIFEILKEYVFKASDAQTALLNPVDLEEPYSINSVRKVLNQLERNNRIEAIKAEGRKEYLYQAKPETEYQNFTFDVVGLWLFHPEQENLLDTIKLRPHEAGYSMSDDSPAYYLEEQVFSTKETLGKVSFFQGTGMIDLNYIGSIAGIQSYRRTPRGSRGAAQRTKVHSWIDNLTRGLGKTFTAMLTSTILYFDKENIEIEEGYPKKETNSDLLRWRIKVPYKTHTYDEEKPGVILDGQQRMWALEKLKLERVFKYNLTNPLPMYGPISVVVGDFPNNEKDEPVGKFRIGLLRMYFLTSNNTQNVSKSLKQLLAQELGDLFLGAAKEVDDFNAIEGRYVDLHLKTIPISPFYNSVEEEIGQFAKEVTIEKDSTGNPIPKNFPRIALIEMVHRMLFECSPPYPSLKDEHDIVSIIRINMDDWSDWIIDHFNAIRCVFKEEWNDPNSYIRYNQIIVSLGKLASRIWDFALRNTNREERMKYLIKKLVIWKSNSEQLSFYPGAFLGEYQPGKLRTKFYIDLFEKDFIRAQLTLEPDPVMFDNAISEWKRITNEAIAEEKRLKKQ